MKPFKLIKNRKNKYIVFNKNICIGLIGSKKNNILKKIIKSQNFECRIFDQNKDGRIGTGAKWRAVQLMHPHAYDPSAEASGQPCDGGP